MRRDSSIAGVLHYVMVVDRIPNGWSENIVFDMISDDTRLRSKLMTISSHLVLYIYLSRHLRYVVTQAYSMTQLYYDNLIWIRKLVMIQQCHGMNNVSDSVWLARRLPMMDGDNEMLRYVTTTWAWYVMGALQGNLRINIDSIVTETISRHCESLRLTLMPFINKFAINISIAFTFHL